VSNWPLLTIVLAGLAVLLFWLEGGAPQGWVYDRVAILDGEWWRLLTGHVSHSDLDHAIWDIAALVIIGALVESRGRLRLVVASLLGVLLIDAYLIWGLPTLLYYAGLSGLVNTWLVLLLADLYGLGQRKLVWLLGLGYLAKLLIEAFTGQALLTETHWPSLPYVHLVGALAGLSAAWIDRCPWNAKPVKFPHKGTEHRQRSASVISVPP
jgi:rhomboid family GlyGly-CTERM serine protease